MAIYALLPDFAPKPMAWGTYMTVADTYFFLCQYRARPPKPAPRLAALHQYSKSPDGKFGFHNGDLPQMNEWERIWETYFTKSMEWALELECEAQAPNPEFDMLCTSFTSPTRKRGAICEAIGRARRPLVRKIVRISPQACCLVNR
jgi:fructosamine-3-kinase